MKIHKARNGAGIYFTSLPKSGEQRIAVSTLHELSGHVTVDPSHITFHTIDGDVQFEILFPPGRHCLTTGKRLPDLGRHAEAEAEAAKQCREHVAKLGKKAVKTERWPHGYITLKSSYACVVVATDLTTRLMQAEV